MKNLALSSLLFLLCLPFANAQEAEKLLLKNLPLQGEQAVVVDLNNPVEIKRWKRSQVQVRLTIELPEQEWFLLKSLIRAHRYDVTAEKTPDGLRVSMPEVFRTVLYKGKPLAENIAIQVFLPKNVELKMPGSAISVSGNLTGIEKK
ncbi:MAG: hypothetical protein AAB316_09730 [Bacteroidota bacterium]